MQSSAEYEYFKDFTQFELEYCFHSPRYFYKVRDNNLIECEDRITEISHKLKIEIESNLVMLSDSKAKAILYLNKLSSRLMSLRKALCENEGNAVDFNSETNEEKRSEFHLYLFKHHLYTLNQLIDNCENKINILNKHNSSGKGRKSLNNDFIPWVGGSVNLRKLFIGLTFKRAVNENENIFIESMTFDEFEKHFLKEVTEPSEKINWLKDKYLLIYLFDELVNEKLIHIPLSSTSDKLIEKHFVVKGKATTVQQLYSSRNTFKKKDNKITGKSTNKAYLQLYLGNLILSIAGKVRTYNDDEEDIRNTKSSAFNRN